MEQAINYNLQMNNEENLSGSVREQLECIKQID